MKRDVDYSDRAIDLRLRRAAQLRALCLSLGASKPIAKTNAPAEPPAGAPKKSS